MCAKCRIRKAIATGSLCALCAAGVTAAGSPAHHGVHLSGVVITRPVAAGPSHEDRPEQPHTPEIEATELPGTKTEILERHVIVVGHPKYGQLNGLNYLGYCDGCPAEQRGDLCYGPCPGETLYPASFGFPPARLGLLAESQPSLAGATSRGHLGEAL
jgi:hypothetical protein